MTAVLSFLVGILLASVAFYVFYSKKIHALKEELITVNAKSKSTEELQEIIKRDFVQLANETIKNEQEDLRKQNRESLEEKILPLTKELGEFKAKVEKFNLAGVENTTKIVEQIGNLEKNNKVKDNNERFKRDKSRNWQRGQRAGVTIWKTYGTDWTGGRL